MYGIKSKLFTALLAGVSFLIISGCKGFAGPEDEESVLPQFSYEIYDENGELLKEVTHERIDETEIETSLGLFGEHFMPTWIAEDIGKDPDDLRQLEIWLHAEKGINEDVHFVTLNFTFPGLKQWESGTHQIDEISKEQWLRSLRTMWEFLQHRNEQYAKQNPMPDINRPETTGQTIKMYYNEVSFETDSTNYIMYLPTGGYLELENVSNDHVGGNFSADMIGLPAWIMTADEFPEDPESQTYRFTGNFVTEHGDFNDLLNLACVEVPWGEQLPLSNPMQSFGCFKMLPS